MKVLKALLRGFVRLWIGVVRQWNRSFDALGAGGTLRKRMDLAEMEEKLPRTARVSEKRGIYTEPGREREDR